MKRILLFCMAALLAVSCNDFPEILYQGLMFGDMTGPSSFHADDGRDYQFTNITPEAGLPSEGRVVALFNAVEKVEGTDNVYRAELLNFNIPVSKAPVLCPNKADADSLGLDPIALEDGYYGGGCLNLVCKAIFGTSNEIKHIINLAVDTSVASDTLHLSLRHDAQSDKMSVTEMEDYYEKSFYASFPMGDLIPSTGEKVIEFTWYWDNQWQKAIKIIKQ